MRGIISKVLTYAFITMIYLFIYAIIRMIFLDIRTMGRKKGGYAQAYLKLVNLRQEFDFPISESYEIEDEVTVGRGRSNTITIKNPFLSDRHMRIFKEDESFFIEDLESTNGTLLNGEKLTDDALELCDGDKIEIGGLKFLFVKPTLKENL